MTFRPFHLKTVRRVALSGQPSRQFQLSALCCPVRDWLRTDGQTDGRGAIHNGALTDMNCVVCVSSTVAACVCQLQRTCFTLAPAVQQTQRREIQVAIYLDTPIAIDALQAAGAACLPRVIYMNLIKRRDTSRACPARRRGINVWINYNISAVRRTHVARNNAYCDCYIAVPGVSHSS